MQKSQLPAWKNRELRELLKENKALKESNLLFQKQLKEQEICQDKKNAEYEKKISTLKLQAGKNGVTAPKGEISLSLGREKEFFDGEAKGIILDALKEYVRNLEPGWRRTHIINSILEANPDKTIQLRKQQLKQVLKDFSGITTAKRKELTELGFEVTANEDRKKHYKLIYFGDSRYQGATAATGSDHRGGQNLASALSKIIL